MRKLLLIILSIVFVAAFAGVCFLRNYPPDNYIPEAALHALENDPKLVLYSLDPLRVVLLENGTTQPLPDDVPKFHGYRILGQTTLSSPDSRRVVIQTIRDAVRHFDGEIHGCFEPRHGIRATDASGTHDFVICFKCRQIYVYSPYKRFKEVYIHGASQPLNDILTAAHVPLPAQ
jgi:hypothetical protein